jgi:hypothetical protein
VRRRQFRRSTTGKFKLKRCRLLGALGLDRLEQFQPNQDEDQSFGHDVNLKVEQHLDLTYSNVFQRHAFGKNRQKSQRNWQSALLTGADSWNWEKLSRDSARVAFANTHIGVQEAGQAAQELG